MSNIVLSKQSLLDYTNDAIQIESAILTVENTIDELEIQQDDLESDLKKALKQEDYRFDKEASNYERTHCEPLPTMPDDPTYPNIILWIFMPIIAIYWFLIVEFKHGRKLKKYRKQLFEIESKNAKIRQEFTKNIMPHLECEHKNNVAKIKKEYKSKSALVKAQKNELTKQLYDLKAIRSKFYALNVMPPDYRTIDCAIVLNQIFRNDLADDVRRAILLYEERVFRGMVIKGLDKILAAINNLSADMQLVVQKMDSINRNVRMMSDDLYAIRASNQKTNEELVSQSKATRYATEQVAESTRILEKHVSRLNT